MSMSSSLPRLLGSQAAASDPDSHVWLSASAGTGKTQVLAARVFRLLLRGVDPAAVLCLTFTKAGAAEMAHRISTRLAAWVRMPMPAVKASQGLPPARNCRRISESALPVTRSCRSFAPALASGWPSTSSNRSS